jgi:alpha-galactosidase
MFEGLERPDRVMVQSSKEWATAQRDGDAWRLKDVEVSLDPVSGGLAVSIRSGVEPLSRIALRWKRPAPKGLKLLGDQWERGYGDLEWRGIVPDRVLPWYFLANSGDRTDGLGVKTGAGALCYWLVASDCVTLCLDVRCGGTGVVLAGRKLEAATIVGRPGLEGESAFAAARAFCRLMCDKPVLPGFPVYGGNNWYYAYGKSSADQILEDSRLISSLSSSSSNRPFMVIDAGWQLGWDSDVSCSGYHLRSDPKTFPDMKALTAGMKAEGVRPGLWFRPLLAGPETPKGWTLHDAAAFQVNPNGTILDPTVPEAAEAIEGFMANYISWGFDLVKHDFSTFDILGKWGKDMGDALTDDGWHFADRSKTTAEVILGLYRTLARPAKGALVIGCNTVSHLAAGIFGIQRTGDDTSGRQWERTRRMGVNTLAFRMPQHGSFYAADADCVGLTNDIPWELNRQWLDLLAGSGTPLFVSADPSAMGSEQRAAVSRAFDIASRALPPAEPLDWLDNSCPVRWSMGGEERRYDWTEDGKIDRLRLPLVL